MIHKSIHHGIEFISEEEDQSKIRAWYDRLPDSEVKSSIIKVRCKEYRPYDQANYRLIVLCNHPFASRKNGSSSECLSEDVEGANRYLDAMIPIFCDWIDRHDMPEEVMLGDRYAYVDWWPQEMLPQVLNDLPPHIQAQREMDNHILDCLELIRLASLPDQDFAILWQRSNEPFFAAGRLTFGDFLWTREVPPGHFHNETDREILLERVSDYSREFVGLMRLASLTDAESPLLDRVLFVLKRFNLEHGLEIPGWLILERDLLDETDGFPRFTKITSEQYNEIDKASDQVRKELVEVTKGLQSEFTAIINAILPTLEAPESSLLFTDKGEHSSPL